MAPKALPLPIEIGAIVVAVETSLADRHHAGLLPQRQQLLLLRQRYRSRLQRMHADAGKDAVMALR